MWFARRIELFATPTKAKGWHEGESLREVPVQNPKKTSKGKAPFIFLGRHTSTAFSKATYSTNGGPSRVQSNKRNQSVVHITFLSEIDNRKGMEELNLAKNTQFSPKNTKRVCRRYDRRRVHDCNWRYNNDDAP